MAKWWLVIDDKRVKRPKSEINLPLAKKLPEHVKQRIINKECERLGISTKGAQLLRVNEVG